MPRSISLFGVTHGMAMGIITLDWGQLSTYNGSPLATPWWAAANTGFTIVIFYWIITVSLYVREAALFCPIPASSLCTPSIATSGTALIFLWCPRNRLITPANNTTYPRSSMRIRPSTARRTRHTALSSFPCPSPCVTDYHLHDCIDRCHPHTHAPPLPQKNLVSGASLTLRTTRHPRSPYVRVQGSPRLVVFDHIRFVH
jgi:hypothetical protein